VKHSKTLASSHCSDGKAECWYCSNLIDLQPLQQHWLQAQRSPSHVTSMGAVASAASSDQALFCYHCQQTRRVPSSTLKNCNKSCRHTPRLPGRSASYVCPTCSSDFIQVTKAKPSASRHPRTLSFRASVSQCASSWLTTAAASGCPARGRRFKFLKAARRRRMMIAMLMQHEVCPSV
jgi:hypothetical protein